MSSTVQAPTRSEAATSSSSSWQPASDDQSLKLAVAISLLRSKLLQKQLPEPSTDPDDYLRWKRKAKERKEEILRLREDLKEAEDASQCELFSKTAICKCYFFDNLGKFSPTDGSTTPLSCSDTRFNDVLRRRFLRQVRFKERRRKASGSNQQRSLPDLSTEDEADNLSASVDFLVELCDTASPDEEPNFTNWSHQAVEFILASLRGLLSVGKNMELVEGIIGSLITRLVKRMCSPFHNSSHLKNNNPQFFMQHLLRKLGSESYLGQRALLAVSQRICFVGEHILAMDPFDDGFVNMHECLFIMIQLIEFMVSDYLLIWSGIEDFDTELFEQWVTFILHARKAMELLENRNVLYMLYMDKFVRGLANLVSQSSSPQKISRDILGNLYR